MSLSAHIDYNDLLLRLYRLSHEAALDDFQDAALNFIKPVLPFDSSMWGSATLTDHGIDVHTIHLHNQPAEMLQAYEEIKHLDTAAMESGKRLASTLAFDANAWFAGDHLKAVRDHGKRFDQAHFFISSNFDLQYRLTRWVTLFRSDSRAHCSEDERLLLSALMPHIQQCLELNRLAHLRQLGGASGARRTGAAIADAKGVLHHMDAGFEHAMKAEWNHWRGNVLPPVVLRALHALPAGQALFTGQTLAITARAQHQLLFLQARPLCRADQLTPREATVARLTAQGNSHKQIAVLLQRSPDTVRSQIRSAYDKLDVSNVAGLIEELRLAE